MSNELKVNAKTDNLEFKRKHNKLVDVVKGNCHKLYKHSITLNLKSSSINMTAFFNFVSDDENQITAYLDRSSKYCIIDFKTENIIGFFGASTVLSIPIETSTSHLIIGTLVPWGSDLKGFNSEKVCTYSGASYFGTDAFTEISLTDNVVEL